ELFEHKFPGHSHVHKLENWCKPNNSYVKFNDPIFVYSSVRSPFRIQRAEKSGLLKIQDLKIPFLINNQILYTIETCEPFENMEQIINIENECFVYLMH